MIIVGGAGNNYGALFGGVFIYIVWTVSEPASVILFDIISDFSEGAGIGAIPNIESRALQMRVFVLGLVITFALRYFPQGLSRSGCALKNRSIELFEQMTRRRQKWRRLYFCAVHQIDW